MPAFTPEQVMLTLALIADLGRDLTSNSCADENQLCTKIQKSLQTLAPVQGSWQLVWGPAVFKFPLVIFPDNVLYVVQSTQDKTQYVVATSGTDPWSVSDWVFEDLLVKPMLPWPYGTPEPLNPWTSTSTAIGLAALQNLKPCAGIPGTGQLLLEYLRGVVANNSSVTVTTTGHSLGGTMSSTMALWLADTQGTANVARADQWDPNNKATVACFCFAGASGGNQDFATYSDNRIGARTQRIWNSLDVVPHAWNIAQLQQIPSLYEPLIQPDATIQGLVSKAIAAVRSDNYVQILATQPPLPGKLNRDFPLFFSQMEYQHVGAYIELLGFSDQLNAALFRPAARAVAK
jgi:Lipase (class 3)